MGSRTIGTRCRSLLAAVGALTLCVALGACGARHDERAAEGGSQAAPAPTPSQTTQERTRGTDSLLSANLIEQIRQLDGNPDPQTTRSVFAGILFNGPGHESPGGPGAWGDSGCDANKPVRVITVRGTNEQLDGGMLGPLAQQIADAFPGRIQVTPLEYAASMEPGTQADGVNLLISTLNGQAEQCPAQRTVLLGYSQGAMVVGDALSAPDVRPNEDNGYTLSDQAAQNIIAAELFGDPRFNSETSYDVGDFTKGTNGVMGARGPHELDRYASRTQSYCNYDDLICQTYGSRKGHREYATNGLRDQAAEYAIGRIRNVLQ